MQPERGDVARSSDPFKLGTGRQRPWLIVNNETHPFDGEQYIAVAISTKAYDDSLALSADVWETGGALGHRTSPHGLYTLHEVRISSPGKAA
ncbi:hypothetical protein C438_11443 [Haloferax denitrificans ATCC 35960]|uniref:Uncharacterized protein n=1 Tax=Haloferax denitrificans ATCC 35960 TaxID=662478 RepID=M0JB64_9EURY|nr:hypothetical protein [Haloferax denitrificans]EMA04920.1 hypothetical protein C438_11443 [Haloferax denitrificans ATCC 35960]